VTRIRKLAEVVLLVHDIEQSVRFYRDVLGLKVISPPNLPGAFLQIGESSGGVPQQIVLAPRPPDARKAATRKAEQDLHHIGLEVEPEDYEAEKSRLAGLGYQLRAGQHPFLPVEAFYLDDPDGNEVEIVARTR
jgi:catechol 2,3-dioxygenase-like lactoylglutathione lyase family enzyme